jgi:subtilisin family serine protease
MFRTPLPDPRDEGRVAKDQARLCRQLSQLADSKDLQRRRHIFDLLDRRRTGDDTLPRIGLLPRARGSEVVIVWGELILRTEDAERRQAAALLKRFGLTPVPIDCLRGRVVRCVNRDLKPRQLDRVARELRSRGISASVNHVAPLAPIGKGLGGPEPTRVRSDHRLAEDQGAGTERVVVAVIDTGITSQTRTDGWLQSVPRGAGTIDRLDAIPRPGDGFLDYGAGHGTFAAGIIHQVAPDVDLRVHQTLDTDGIASEVDVACALVDAVEAGADIVNLSLGGGTADDLPPVALAVALEIIAEYERQHERENDRVLLVAAAGNNGDTSPVWPAAFRRVLSVAALTSDLRPASWSSSGFWVDCSTVGEGIVSTYVEGKESPELDLQPDTYGPDPWAFWSGTSFAAPQVVGAVARLRQEGSPSVRDALNDLLGSGRPVPGFGQAVRILPGTGD